MLVEDWSQYPSFSEDEFKCKHSGIVKMEKDFMRKLQYLRDVVAQPFIITSGYRSANHPTEKSKKYPGEHYYGRACDVKCHTELAHNILKNAGLCGFTRLGIKQTGPHEERFIHLGTSDSHQGFISPTVWTYA
jgi:hypothetical protein